MPQYLNQATVNFTAGLNTEAGWLNFPENASVDELNCTLERSGHRKRRLGVELESGTSASSETYVEGQVVRTLTWENVGGVAGVEFAVVQIGTKLRFYDKSVEKLSSGEVPISDSDANPYILDMSTYNSPNGNGAGAAPIQVASVKGALVVVSPNINSFYITRSTSDNSFTVTQLDFKYRDREWLGDTSTYYTELATASTSLSRQYDTRNAGWRSDGSSAPLDTYISSTTAYPPLNIAWHAAKDSSDNYSQTTFVKLSQEEQTSLIANGKFILGLYDGDRDAASGLTGVTAATEDSRFSCVEEYAGRVFLAGMSSERNSSRIYYSQTLLTLDDMTKLHTQNDPTAEFLSDGLDTDGGYIEIPEAHDIRYLYAWGNFLMVLADNGIWTVDGVDGVFRSTEYRVRKLSEVGIRRAESFVAAEGTPFWWSDTGIYTISSNQVGEPNVSDLTRSTIQTFWNNIDTGAKEQVVGEFDLVDKKVFWFYPSNSETVTGKLNEALILDLPLQAFYPWRISDAASNSPYIIGTSFYRGVASQEQELTVVDDDGNTVVDGSGNTVVVTRFDTLVGTSTRLNLLTYTSTGGIQWAEFNDTDFLDWGSADYSSYAESRYDMMGDLVSFKTAPYITVYLKVTETGWTASGTGYVPVREGSCLVSAYWDWKKTTSSTAQEAHRYKAFVQPDPNDLSTFDIGTDVIQTRLRIRGRGRSMRLRFESSTGKDFEIIGWGLVGARNDRF